MSPHCTGWTCEAGRPVNLSIRNVCSTFRSLFKG